MTKITIDIDDEVVDKLRQRSVSNFRSLRKEVISIIYQSVGMVMTLEYDEPKKPSHQLVIPPKASTMAFKACRQCSERISAQEYEDHGGYCEQHRKKAI